MTDADEGTLSAGSITSRTRREQWTLSQPGNWADNPWDFNGDGDYLDVGSQDTDRTYNSVTYNVANGQTSRTNAWGTGGGTSTTTYAITHDAAGNETDDGWHAKYEYDAWSRLRKVVKSQSSALVEEHTYNGLGHRIGWHYDVDADGTVENSADDPWRYFAYDDRWTLTAGDRRQSSLQLPPLIDLCIAIGASGHKGSPA